MRYELKFLMEEPVLPLDYRRSILSFLKFALSNYEEGRFFNEFYEPGVDTGISFAPLLLHPIFKSNTIELSSKKLVVLLSIPQKKTAFIFLNALLNILHKSHPISATNKFTLQSVSPVPDRKIRGNVAVFKFLSPLCLRLHDQKTNHDSYVSIRHENFKNVLLDSLRWQVRDYDRCFASLVDSLEVDTSCCKKTVVLHYDCKIEVTIGQICFKGDTDLLNILNKINWGSRRSAGFGLAKLIGEEVIL